MTSHNSSSASNYSMSSSGREEARRKHFLSLHKRRRFQAKYNVEEVAENGCSNNNATFGNEELSPVGCNVSFCLLVTVLILINFIGLILVLYGKLF